MNLIRINYIFFVGIIIILVAFSVQSNNVAGKYVLVNTKDTNCTIHTLLLKPDSTYEYKSQCQNSYGIWSVKNKNVILNFENVRTYGFYSDFYFTPGQSGVIIRLWGKNTLAEFVQKKRTELVPTAPISPLVCEEVTCWYNGKEYSSFTNNSGEVLFPKINEIDSLLLKSLYEYNKSKGIKCGVLTKKANFPYSKINNANFYFSCHSGYHRFVEIKKFNLQITPKGLVSQNVDFVNGVMPAGIWNKK